MSTLPLLDSRTARLRLAMWTIVAGLAGCQSRAPDPKATKPRAPDAVVQALETISRTGRGIPGGGSSPEARAQLARLYDASAHTPLWVNSKGTLRPVGAEALQRLVKADADGLRPEDYAAGQLDSLARQVSAQEKPDPQTVARLDAGMTVNVLGYLRHLHVGRVNPRSVGFALDPPHERHDYVTLLSNALREGSLDEVVAELEPPLAQYRLTRDALTRYRSRPADSLAERPLRLPVPLKPGQAAPGLDALVRRLTYTGDLATALAPVPLRYSGPLVAAVSRFQARHGLAPDSVLGQGTLDELNVPLSWRAHQLELTLERLRWLRDLDNEPFVLVNIPMFELTAWSSPMASGPPAFRSGVIVGKALDTQTPVFVEEMRYLIFRPYWNIPPSIARDETVPAIEKDGSYLRKNDMEIVRGQGDDADPVELSDDVLERVSEGQLRIRQRPGANNSLGLVKFVFPNDENVYLHGTPAAELFDRNRRDFSHGCVRVEDPVGLAEWVLRDQPEWTRERIVEAMEDETKVSRRLTLTRPLTVVLFYTTALVESDGRVRFAKDIYGHDERLDQALHLAAAP